MPASQAGRRRFDPGRPLQTFKSPCISIKPSTVLVGGGRVAICSELQIQNEAKPVRKKHLYQERSMFSHRTLRGIELLVSFAPRSLFLLVNGRLFYSGNPISIDSCAIGLFTRGQIRWRRTYLKYHFARAIFYFEAIRI